MGGIRHGKKKFKGNSKRPRSEKSRSIFKNQEFKVQLQTFTRSDLFIFKIALIIISCRIESKNEKKLFNYFEISKNII